MHNRARVAVAIVAAIAAATWLLVIVPAGPSAVAAVTHAPVQIDFGTATSSPADGYVADHGQAFGPRSDPHQGVGLSYGWVKDGTSIPFPITGNGRSREGTGLTDVKLTTLMQMQPESGPAAWEVRIDDGWYLVTAGLGDAAPVFDSTQTVTAEGRQVMTAFIPNAGDRLRSGTTTVQVTDGRLTIRPEGGSNVKITYLTIVGTEPPADTSFVFKVDFGAASSTPAPGNVLDFGEAFGQHTDGEYGWVATSTGQPMALVGHGRQRAPADRVGEDLADQRQGNFVHMQTPADNEEAEMSGTWAISVPNGTYHVEVGTGDADNNYDSEHAIEVEGKVAIAPYTPTYTDKFRVGAVDVRVVDSILTVSSAAGTNTKIDFVEITGIFDESSLELTSGRTAGLASVAAG